MALIEPTARHPRAIGDTVPTRCQSVLVVEDDQLLREFLLDVLREEGYEVRAAVDGRDALVQLADWRPNVILTDIAMPNLDGWALRAQLRTHPTAANVPVIVMSGFDYSEAEQAFEAAAMLPKPFSLTDLLRVVEQIATPPAT